MVVIAAGQPVDFTLTPGSVHDMPGFRCLLLDLPEGSTIYAGKGCTDFEMEDLLKEVASVELIAARKSNSKRPHLAYVGYLCQVIRKRVETIFSQITERFSRSVPAVTARGFELKVFLTLLAYSVFA